MSNTVSPYEKVGRIKELDTLRARVLRLTAISRLSERQMTLGLALIKMLNSALTDDTKCNDIIAKLESGYKVTAEQ